MATLVSSILLNCCMIATQRISLSLWPFISTDFDAKKIETVAHAQRRKRSGLLEARHFLPLHSLRCAALRCAARWRDRPKEEGERRKERRKSGRLAEVTPRIEPGPSRGQGRKKGREKKNLDFWKGLGGRRKVAIRRKGNPRPLKKARPSRGSVRQSTYIDHRTLRCGTLCYAREFSYSPPTFCASPIEEREEGWVSVSVTDLGKHFWIWVGGLGPTVRTHV